MPWRAPTDLNQVEQRALLRELLAREKRAAERGVASKATENELDAAKALERKMYPLQHAFFFPKPDAEGRINKRRLACCTRRTGKTTGDAIKLLCSLLRNPRDLNLYMGLTQATARETIWTIMKELIADYDLPLDAMESTATIRHKRSVGTILLKGADTLKDVEKRRGIKPRVAILDESGSMGADLEQAVISVIGPGLRDLDGELLLNGTPGYHPSGLFYEVQAGLRPNWEVHRWGLDKNPFLSKQAKDLTLICDEEGLTRDDPRFIREYLGQYVLNCSTQMFAYNPATNSFTAESGAMPPAAALNWYLGVDFGWTDASAIVPLGWTMGDARIWVPESWAESKQGSDEVASQLMKFIAKYHPKRIIGDTGGYGKGVAEQIWKDYRIYIEQAVKREKLNHVEFMNSAFLRGDIQIERSSGLAKELPGVLWNERKTDAHAHSDDNTSHALMYAWRAIHNLKVGNKKGENPEISKVMGIQDSVKQQMLLEELGPATAWFLRD